MMKPEVKTLWVDRLRSMSEEQHGKNLLNYGGRFCPLGVLCQVYSEATGTPWIAYSDEFRSVLYLLGNHKILPDEVMEWAGVDSPIVFLEAADGRCHIPELNDNRGYTFKQIADLIERQL